MTNKLELLLNQATGEKKNKKIEDISTKIKKIEKLTLEFDALKDKIKSIKVLVEEKSALAKIRLCETKEKYVLLLIEKYSLKGFTKWQKAIMSELITDELDLLSKLNYRSEMLQESVSKYLELQREQMSSLEKQFMKEGFKGFMDEFDLDFDNEELDFSKMNDPQFKKDFEQKIRDKQQEFQENEKQRLKEKQVAKTDIDFQKVYKKLAKLAHPDLYKSTAEKEVKEIQMQKLTKAWDERDYYEIIMLWMEIDPENTIELEITEKNQRNIIAQLNGKIEDLEDDIYDVKYNYEDTSFYYQNFNAPSQNGIETKLKKYIKSLIVNSERTTLIHNDIQKTVRLKAYLTEIYENQEEEDFEDMFEDFFNQFME
jgi:hypothetical protein